MDIPSVSETVMTEVVFPNDTNPLGYLRGGKMMDWMDTACAIAAQMHSGRIAVTVSARELTFQKPVKAGDIVTLRAKVIKTRHSSMEIEVTAYAHRTLERLNFRCNQAVFTFVAVDGDLRPVSVPQL